MRSATAEWTGVPLAAVLKRAGVKAGATEVVLEGADNGAIAKEPVSPGKIHYARSLPLAKALMPEVILAYRMNSEPCRLRTVFRCARLCLDGMEWHQSNG